MAQWSPAAVGAAGLLWLILDGGPMNQWFITPEQRAQALFRDGRFADAARLFGDPARAGTAWFRAGEFEQAALAFGRSEQPEAAFNRGNALVMLGKYDDAIRAYDDALEQRSDWASAKVNREIAQLRAERLKKTGGDMTGGRMQADQVEFDLESTGDRDNRVPATSTDEAGAQALSNEQIQALWLRKVQTRPADFLRARFAHQQARLEAAQ